MTSLPTGTVTFVFTDIEGSTALLRYLGRDGFGEVHDEHTEIVRSAIGEHGGTEIRTEGDAFFAVFPSAPGAVRASIEMQRRLAAHAWPSGSAVRVRIGMHTGEGTLGGDDYMGLDVHRAARVAATGHGGQVVLSEATRAVLDGGLPDGVAFRDLGQHRLKDFDTPERLSDLVIDDLPAEFPPLRSLDGRRTNLRAMRSSLVGRVEEVESVTTALRELRLVTLTGPGGTGKTRLGLAVAERWLDRTGEEVYLVDLSAVTDPALIVGEVAAALRIREQPGRDLEAIVREYLRDRSVLLMLDNLEQLAEGAGAVATLLDEAPELRVLATSRVPLRLRGEQEIAVAPLPLPQGSVDLDLVTANDAARLFVERAQAVRPGFRLDASTADDVVRIVESMDGLPLAVELAAAQLRVLEAGELAARLERHLPMPAAGPRDAPARQRTLAAAIEWSYEALGDDDRSLFGELAVFAGGWTLEGAEAVTAHPDPLSGLTALIEQSLVSRSETTGGGSRYRMLVTIRAYASERLPADRRRELELRHAIWFRDVAETAEPHLTGEQQLRWLGRLEEEHDNLRAVFDRAIAADDPAMTQEALRIGGAVWRFWHARGHLAEGRGLLERVLALPSASDRTRARCLALGALGSIEYWQLDYPSMTVHYEEHLAIARELGDRRMLAAALLNASSNHVATGDLAAHMAMVQEAVEVADPDDRALLADIWSNIGFNHLFSGAPAEAFEPIERSVALYREMDEPVMLCEALTALAAIPYLQGDLPTAAGYLREAVEVAVAMPSPQTLSRVLLPGALLAVGLERFDRAAVLMGAASRIEDEHDLHFPEIGVQMLGDPGVAAREALGDERYEQKFADGWSLTQSQVVDMVAET